MKEIINFVHNHPQKISIVSYNMRRIQGNSTQLTELDNLRLQGKLELHFLKEEREKRIKKDNALSLHIRNLKKSKKVLTEWDDTVWTVMVEKAIIHKVKTITFIFYNGSLVRVGM